MFLPACFWPRQMRPINQSQLERVQLSKKLASGQQFQESTTVSLEKNATLAVGT